MEKSKKIIVPKAGCARFRAAGRIRAGDMVVFADKSKRTVKKVQAKIIVRP
jgi:hypothetical protein